MYKRIKLVLIRHGQAIGNKKGQYIGCRSDVSLSSEGIQLTKEKKNKYQKLWGDEIYLFSSPMKRCLETAEILWPDSIPTVIYELKEIDFGRFEGESFYTLNGNVEYQRWIDSDGTLPFPEGESKEEFTNRIMRGFRQITDRMKNCDMCEYPIVICGHGGTIMAIMSELTGCDYYSFQVRNLGGYVLEIELKDEGINTLSYNSI